MTTTPEETNRDERKLVPVKNNPGIYKRGNRYVVVYREGRERKQKKRFARSLAEARQIQSERRSERDLTPHRRGQMLFTEFAKEWVEDYAGRTGRESGLKDQTRADYRAAVTRSEFVKHFRGLRLVEVEPAHIREYGELLARGNGRRKPLSPRTVRNLILPIRLMLADAKDDNYIRSNPAAGLKVKAALGRSEADARPLVDDEEHGFELQRLLRVLPEASPQMRLLIKFLLQTGLRIGEALALTWADVRFDEKKVWVLRRAYKGTLEAPKSKHGTRYVPLSPGMVTLLRAHRKQALSEGRGSPERLVFHDGDGGELKYHAARAEFRKLMETAGLPWVGFHTLRHTCATLLIARKKNGGLECHPLELQRWLGHHSAEFTMKVYGHLWNDQLPAPTHFDRLLVPRKGARPKAA